MSNMNDGGTQAPALRCYMNLEATESMTQFSHCDLFSKLGRIKEAGYEGVQFGAPVTAQALSHCRELGLGVAQSGRINLPAEADGLAQQFASEGAEAATIHLGWGTEDDGEASRLIEALLHASTRHRIPLYPETHRATLFQDMWRTVQFVKKYPELRFNGDFSHWYTGLEMVYGGVDRKLDCIAPVLERIRFLHGRIGSPGSIQVDIGEGDVSRHPYVADFKKLWTSAFAGFQATAVPGDYVCFVPELLGPEHYYARTLVNPAGEVVEEGNRWSQSKVLVEIAKDCFREATRDVVTARNRL